MEFLVNFILIFVVVYSCYYVMSVRKARKNGKHVPVEVQYLLIKYQISLKKIRYKRFVNSVALIGSFDIALVGSFILYIKGMVFQLLFGFILLVPIILISFRFLGNYYQKISRGRGVFDAIEEMEPQEVDRVGKSVIREKRKRSKGERRNG